MSYYHQVQFVTLPADIGRSSHLHYVQSYFIKSIVKVPDVMLELLFAYIYFCFVSWPDTAFLNRDN